MTRTEVNDSLGVRGLGATDLVLEDVFVGAESLVGEPGQGFQIANANYKSCMSYNNTVSFQLVDYHVGALGNVAFQDWNTMDIANGIWTWSTHDFVK